MKSDDIIAERRRLMAQPDWLQVKTIGPITFSMNAHDRVLLLLQLRLAMTAPINTGVYAYLAQAFQSRMYVRLLGKPTYFLLKPGERDQFTLNAMEALMFLSQLQLALTHKANRHPNSVADMTRTLGRKIQEHLSINPTISQVCELGWEVEHDRAI